jgi:DNA-binding LytR/AlgR family response regulator
VKPRLEQQALRKRRDKSLKMHQSSLALRQIRDHLRHRTVVIILIGVALVLGVSGPFGTFELLTALPRLAYWLVTVFATYACAMLIIIVTRGLFPAHWPTLLRDCTSGLIAGPFITAVVLLINATTFPIRTGSDLTTMILTLLPYCTVIVVVVTVLISQIEEQFFDAPNTNETAPLLTRLPFDKRGTLISLQAQDHYVNVVTSKGEDLILMRFSDALKEVGSEPGFQTHRSFWVAQSQIQKVQQKGERGLITLTNGTELPVSRNFMPKLKTAGYL